MSSEVIIGSRVPRRGNAFTRWLGRYLLRKMGWSVHGQLPDEPKVMVVCAPHTSNMDGLLVAAVVMALQVRIKVMAKDSLFRPPLSGFMKWVGGLPIDRNAAGGIVQASIDKFAEYDQLWVGVAPEGTRHASEQWKTGFYRIAAGAGVPVTMAVMDYAKKEIRFPLTLWPGNDPATDNARILECYRGAQGRHPERMSRPLRRMLDEDQ